MPSKLSETPSDSPTPSAPEESSRTTKRSPESPPSAEDKLLYRALNAKGYDIPKELQNNVVAKSKKGKLGQIRVRRMSGVDDTAAARVVRLFEQNVGRDQVREALEVAGDELSQELVAVREALRSGSKHSLRRLVAENRAEVGSFVSAVEYGLSKLGRTMAIIESHRQLPHVVKDIARHALDSPEVCDTCVGLGKVPAKVTDSKETLVCPSCRGSGSTLVSSKHKEWAAKQLLEMTGMTGKGGGTTVNVSQKVGVAVKAGGDMMERQMDVVDAILSEPKEQGE